MNDVLLSCQSLAKSYGKHKVFADCSFQLAPGELVGLIGENGAGKSTLLRCVLGFTRPTSGSIELVARVGYCPQGDVLNRRFTVDEHLQLVRAIYLEHCTIDNAYINELIERFNLEKYLSRKIVELSGGTRQKVMFLTAILHRPSLLFLDEPYDGFDWEMYLTFWDTVKELTGSGTCMLLVTHLIHDRERFDRILELREGSLHDG